MIKKATKIKKRSVVKRKSPMKKKPVIIKEVVVEKPKIVFHGTIYELRIMEICAENEFPFDYRRAKIDGNVVDFCNRTKRLIIEVYNPDRSWEEVQARLRAFLIQGFKRKYITKDKLSMRNWRKVLVASIKRFLE